MKKLLLIPALLLLAACDPVPATPENSEASSSSAVSVAAEVSLDWKVWPSESDESGQPHSSLFITVGDEDVKIGDYGGTFSDLRVAGVEPEGNLLMHGQYWWAGGGDEIRVERTEDGIRVLHRPIDEEVDPGEFTVLQTVPLAAGTTVNVAPVREQY